MNRRGNYFFWALSITSKRCFGPFQISGSTHWMSCRSGHREGSRSVTAWSGQMCPTFVSWPHLKGFTSANVGKNVSQYFVMHSTHRLSVNIAWAFIHAESGLCLQHFDPILGQMLTFHWLHFAQIKILNINKPDAESMQRTQRQSFFIPHVFLRFSQRLRCLFGSS